jgi:hypothetical protein
VRVPTNGGPTTRAADRVGPHGNATLRTIHVLEQIP